MTDTLDRLPEAAITPITDAGRFQAYAVPSRSGPHVTMQAGLVQAGRFWTTTSASSLKSRSVERHRTATAVVADDEGHRVVSGPTIALRPFHPWSALGDPVAGVLAGRAVACLGLAQAEQLLGYVEAGRAVPADWLPTRRVLLVTKIERELTVVDGEVVDATGTWDRSRFTTALGAMPVDAPAGTLPVDRLDRSQQSVVREESRVHLGLETPTGPVAVPARYTGQDRFSVSASVLSAVTADVGGRASAVFDESRSRRPDEKRGVMFRGSIRLVDQDGADALVALDTEKITSWNGFEATTTEVPR